MSVITTPVGQVDPTFAQYPDTLAAALTGWLYGNKESNPQFNDPSKWGESGFAVTFLDRSLTFAAVPAGGSVPTKLNLGGGKNVIVFSRVAAVTPSEIVDDPNTIVLPNQLSNFVTVEQKRTDGLVVIQADTPILSTFGWGLAPYVLPVPERWLGNLEQLFTVTNNLAYAVDITLSWHIAILTTGR